MTRRRDSRVRLCRQILRHGDDNPFGRTLLEVHSRGLLDGARGQGRRGPGIDPEGPTQCLFGFASRGPELDQCGQASYAWCTLCPWLHFTSCSLNSFAPTLLSTLTSPRRYADRIAGFIVCTSSVRESSNIIVWIANQ